MQANNFVIPQTLNVISIKNAGIYSTRSCLGGSSFYASFEAYSYVFTLQSTDHVEDSVRFVGTDS